MRSLGGQVPKQRSGGMVSHPCGDGGHQQKGRSPFLCVFSSWAPQGPSSLLGATRARGTEGTRASTGLCLSLESFWIELIALPVAMAPGPCREAALAGQGPRSLWLLEHGAAASLFPRDALRSRAHPRQIPSQGHTAERGQHVASQ